MLGLITTNCRPKDEVLDVKPAQVLRFASDTILFDTVLSTQRSPTQYLKVYNPNATKINLEYVRLEPNSPFRLTVNGQKGNQIANIEILGNDSIWVMLEVSPALTITDSTYSLIDKLSFKVQGQQNPQTLPVIATAENVHLYFGKTIVGNEIWNNDGRPYLLFDSLVIPNSASLTINPGVKVFNSATNIWLVKGSLKMNGTVNSHIVLTGTRQEKTYDNQPAQWGGIVLWPNASAQINYAEINNGTFGIQAGFLNASATPATNLELSNTIFKNHSQYGLVCFNAYVEAVNNQFIDCALANLAIYQGGDYTFWHNTLAYSNTQGYVRRSPSVIFADYYADENKIYPDYPLKINVVNNIISGGLVEDFIISPPRNQNSTLVLSNNLIRSAKSDYANNNILLFVDFPYFLNSRVYNFRLKDTDTLAKRKGISLSAYPQNKTLGTLLNKDYGGNFRLGLPSIGCYQ